MERGQEFFNHFLSQLHCSLNQAKILNPSLQHLLLNWVQGFILHILFMYTWKLETSMAAVIMCTSTSLYPSQLLSDNLFAFCMLNTSVCAYKYKCINICINIYTHTIFGSRGIVTGIYTTNSPEACHYIAYDSKTNIMVVENRKQLDKIMQVRGGWTVTYKPYFHHSWCYIVPEYHICYLYHGTFHGRVSSEVWHLPW